MDKLPNQPRLNSWKEIADYLERDVRTAMRWAKSDGLPVHRVGAGTRRAVYAYVIEIDEWLANGRVRSESNGNGNGHGGNGATDADESDEVSRPSRWHPAWLVAIGVVLLGVIGIASRFTWAGGTTAIARASVIGRELVAVDSAGRDLWRREIAPINERTVGPHVSLVQWEDRGPLEVLVAASIERPTGDGTGALMLFGQDGQLKWRRVLENRYTFGATEYGPTWYPSGVVTYRTGGTPRIAATFHHHTWWPGLVSAFDRDGAPVSTFVNPGWMHHLNVTKDGRYLLAAGVSNALGGAVLAVLDVNNTNGTPPSADSSLPPCGDCPAGAPVAYLLVPWSDIARPSDTPDVPVQVTDAGQIDLRSVQRLPREGVVPEIIVSISPSLDVTQRGVSDSFGIMHAEMERTGALDHPMSRCPWNSPVVKKWTPAKGWEEIR